MLWASSEWGAVAEMAPPVSGTVGSMVIFGMGGTFWAMVGLEALSVAGVAALLEAASEVPFFGAGGLVRLTGGLGFGLA